MCIALKKKNHNSLKEAFESLIIEWSRKEIFLSRLGRVCVTKKNQKKRKITMVQLIGNFDFAALCLPTVPWGKSTRKMQFFRKVIIQIPDRSVLFFESFFRVCFCGCRIIFFSPPILFCFSRQLNFPLSEIFGRRRRFGFNSGKIRRDSACIRRYECSVVLCARF